MFCKMANFELQTRVPMMIRAVSLRHAATLHPLRCHPPPAATLQPFSLRCLDFRLRPPRRKFRLCCSPDSLALHGAAAVAARRRRPLHHRHGRAGRHDADRHRAHRCACLDTEAAAARLPPQCACLRSTRASAVRLLPQCACLRSTRASAVRLPPQCACLRSTRASAVRLPPQCACLRSARASAVRLPPQCACLTGALASASQSR